MGPSSLRPTANCGLISHLRESRGFVTRAGATARTLPEAGGHDA
jgi:hypothetical protein